MAEYLYNLTLFYVQSLLYTVSSFVGNLTPNLFEPQLKYGWFRLNFSRFKPALICIQFFGGFETRLKFIKFGLKTYKLVDFQALDKIIWFIKTQILPKN